MLVKLRSGETFSPRERAPHEVAQTKIRRQLHDDLDAAVATTYGWPVDLPDADILVNLVALNKERAAEEAIPAHQSRSVPIQVVALVA